MRALLARQQRDDRVGLSITRPNTSNQTETCQQLLDRLLFCTAEEEYYFLMFPLVSPQGPHLQVQLCFQFV